MDINAPAWAAFRAVCRAHAREPVAALERRAAVEKVVFRDVVEQLLVAEPAPSLIHHDAVARCGHLATTRVVEVELLHDLDGIGRFRRAYRLTDNTV